jgi:hypothetical protein
MKKIIVLITMLFSATSVAQTPGWTNLKETNITVGSSSYDIFTNGAGNHIIVQETSTLKYYKMDINGNTVSPTPIALESSTVTSPSISGDATRLYAVYRKTNNKITTKYSDDGGLTWSYLSDLNTSGNAGSIECVFVKNQLHITYLVGTTVYHAYFRPNLLPPSWSTPEPVYPSGPTSDPRIAAWNEIGNEQVFFTYTNNTNFRWTRYNVNSQSYFDFYFHLGGVNDINLGIGVDDQYVYGLYKEQTTNILS